MGNHSETGELLEEVRAIPLTGMSVSGVSTLVDEQGNTIELGNPTRLKDSSGRAVLFLKNESPDNDEFLKNVITIETKDKKKKAS